MDNHEQADFKLVYDAIEEVWKSLNEDPWKSDLKELSLNDRKFINTKYQEAKILNLKENKSTDDLIQLLQIRDKIKNVVRCDDQSNVLKDYLTQVLNIW